MDAKARVQGHPGGCGPESGGVGSEEAAPRKVRRVGGTHEDADADAASAAVRRMQAAKQEKQDQRIKKQLKKANKKRKSADEEDMVAGPDEGGDAEGDDAASNVIVGKDGVKTRGTSEALIFTPVMVTKEDEREKLVLDDFLAALSFAKDNLPYGATQEDFARTKQFLLSLFLELCWAGSVSVNGKAFRVYSQFRFECQRLVYAAHQQKLHFGQKKFDPLALASTLLDLVKTPVPSLAFCVRACVLRPCEVCCMGCHPCFSL